MPWLLSNNQSGVCEVNGEKDRQKKNHGFSIFRICTT